MPNATQEITREEFLAYEQVRQSGATNMMAVNMVQALSGLDRQSVFAIMNTYGELAKKYLGEDED